MTLPDCRSELSSRLEGAAPSASPRTMLSSLAREFHEMARSYLKDGDYFLDSRDPVNALASWSYAIGWLDAGISLGLLSATCSGDWLFGCLELPEEIGDRLQEKALRYERMLDAALGSAVTAPEEETIMGEASLRFRCVASLLLEWGRLFLGQGRGASALACFSYGHAWMDAGVRSGLFLTGGSRDLFAV